MTELQKFRLNLWICGAVILTAPNAFAASELSQSEKNFLVKAAQSAELEIKLGELAASRGSTPAVRGLGQRIAKDQSTLNDKLRDIAAKRNLAIPAGSGQGHGKMLSEMEALSGGSFDQPFVARLITDHLNDMSEFQAQATSSQDAEIRALASNAMAKLQEHLTLAEEAKKTL